MKPLSENRIGIVDKDNIVINILSFEELSNTLLAGVSGEGKKVMQFILDDVKGILENWNSRNYIFSISEEWYKVSWVMDDLEISDKVKNILLH